MSRPGQRMLLTWSDRGSSGPRPEHHGQRPSSDRGPILRLLDQPESAGLYEAALVLTTAEGLAPAAELVASMRAVIPSVELRALGVRDPTDFGQLFHALEPLPESLPSGLELDVLLSAGTPQVQALWLILVQAGLLRARMLQVIPAAFVPDPHPRAIREVRLEIDGFPEIRALREELGRLRAEQQALTGAMLGQSPPMLELARRIGRLARSEVPVLVEGETGTGKELIARALHDGSARAAKPFVAENCGAFEEGVLASELFGHERGAFTGAVGRRRGLFEQAHGGTLFLDEIGEMPLRVQAHLLRVLQEGELRRVGGEGSVRVDVRVVAATHRDLPSLVQEGRFREDLYYRIRGASLRAPPLRERSGDLELLVRHFLHEARAGRLRLTREAWKALSDYRWPGNVRELRAEVLRWSVFCDEWVRPEDLSSELQAALGRPAVPAPAPPAAAASVRPLAEAVAEAERHALRHGLEAGGSISAAARALGIDRNTLKRKMRLYGLE